MDLLESALEYRKNKAEYIRIAMWDIERYLLAHEQEIAAGEKDFGELRQAFRILFDREANQCG